MGVCRRIFKNYEPTELTICVTIYSEPRSPPRFDRWTISKPGFPPQFIPCSKGTSSSFENGERRAKRKVLKKRKKSDASEKSEVSEKSEIQPESHEKPLLHSTSATLISDDVITKVEEEEGESLEKQEVKPRARHVSVTSLDSIAGLGGLTSEECEETSTWRSSEVVVEHVEEIQGFHESSEEKLEDVKRDEKEKKQEPKGRQFDLLANGDVAIPTIELMMNDASGEKKKLLTRKKKKSKTPDSTPRYREFTETSINMYIEMNKQNLGEFVWDQQCTRIDALVAPILELDRTTTPEIPVEIDVFD